MKTKILMTFGVVMMSVMGCVDSEEDPDPKENVAPTWATPTKAVSIEENSPEGTVITTVTEATDENDDPLTYDFSEGGEFGDRFAFDPGSRTLTVGSSGLDYETDSNMYEVLIQADDGKGGTADYTVTITLTDEEYENPSDIRWQQMGGNYVYYNKSENRLSRITLDTNVNVLIGGVRLTFKSAVVDFYEDGAVLTATLTGEVNWTNTAGTEFVFLGSGGVKFFPDGKVRFAYLTDDHDLITLGDYELDLSRVFFDAAGTVVMAKLGIARTIGEGEEAIEYSTNIWIRFYADNGEIAGTGYDAGWLGERDNP